ncbi:hypothetical protein [Dyella lipolytica]|uniref:hypothetical protein n=1 Tax=Dyella lipolytica TaxID=1867835 RepID=UPI0024E0EFC1|nr:hypothetical protein [Dyella lipolytica]
MNTMHRFATTTHHGGNVPYLLHNRANIGSYHSRIMTLAGEGNAENMDAVEDASPRATTYRSATRTYTYRTRLHTDDDNTRYKGCRSFSINRLGEAQ